MADEQHLFLHLIDFVAELFCIEIDYALDKSVHEANRHIRSDTSSSGSMNDDAHVLQTLLHSARTSIVECLSAENMQKIRKKAFHPSPLRNYIQTTEITLATITLDSKYHDSVDYMLRFIFRHFQSSICQEKILAFQPLKDGLINQSSYDVQDLVTSMHKCCIDAVLDVDMDMLMEGMNKSLNQQSTELECIPETPVQVISMQEAGTSTQANVSILSPANPFNNHTVLGENGSAIRTDIDQLFENQLSTSQDDSGSPNDDNMINLTVSDDEEEEINTSAFLVQSPSSTCITYPDTPTTEITPAPAYQPQNQFQSAFDETKMHIEEEEVDMLDDDQDDEEPQDSDEDVPLSVISSKVAANSSFPTTRWKSLLPTPAVSSSSSSLSLLSVNEILDLGYGLVQQVWKAGDDRLIKSFFALDRKKVVKLLQEGLNDKASNFLCKYANGLPVSDHELKQIAFLGSKKSWRSVVMTVFQNTEGPSADRTSSQVHSTIHSAYITKCARRPELMVNVLRGTAKSSYYFYSHLSSNDGFGNSSLKAMSVPLWTCGKELDLSGIFSTNEMELAKLAFVRLAKSVLIFCFWTLQNDAAINERIRFAFPKAITAIRGLNYSASLGSCAETYGLMGGKSKSVTNPRPVLPTSTLPPTPSRRQSMASMVTTWMGCTAQSVRTLSGEEEKQYRKKLRQLSSKGIATVVFPLKDKGTLRACINFSNNRKLILDFLPLWLQGKSIRPGEEIVVRIMLRKGETFTEDGKGRDATLMIYAMVDKKVIGYNFKTKTSTSISAQILQDAVELRKRDKRGI